MHGENIEAMQQICIGLNQRLKFVVSDSEFRVATSDLTNMTAPEWYTISGVVNVGAPELLEIVAVLRSAGASHVNVTPLTYRFVEESVSVRALRERLKRLR
jgi:ATP phosphoribosyltransferase